MNHLYMLILSALVLSSCASPEKVQERADKRNRAYMNFEENMKIRQEASDERIDAWYDRVMD